MTPRLNVANRLRILRECFPDDPAPISLTPAEVDELLREMPAPSEGGVSLELHGKPT